LLAPGPAAEVAAPMPRGTPEGRNRCQACRQCPSEFPEERNVFISNAYAQAGTAASPENGLLGMLPLVLMFVVLYFVMIRPQMKRQKEHKAMIEAVQKGDEVVTAGGLIGKIAKLGDNFIHLEVANGVEVQLQRSAITQVLPKGSVKAA
jgi:preprotein translocase subunit YajC